MATCGPSNGFQDFKAHIQRDASLQRETVTSQDPRQNNFRTTRGKDAYAQFEAVNAFNAQNTEFGREFSPLEAAGTRFSVPPPANVGYMRTHDPMHDLTQNPQYHHHSRVVGAPARAQAVQSPAFGAQGWASEFSQLNNSKAQEIPFHSSYDTAAAPSWGYQPQQPMFGPPSAFSSQFSSMHNSMGPLPSMGAPMASQIPDNSAMEAAFAEAEQSLRGLQLNNSGTKPAEETQSQQRGNDASEVAATIINTVNDRADPELSSKVRGSKFMNLMTKLKNNEVEIDSTDFVSTKTHSKVDTDNLEPADASEFANSEQSKTEEDTEPFKQDWPPTRETAAAREQPPEVQNEPKSSHRFSRKLDDPETYLRKLKQNLDPRLFEVSPYLSPFFKAQELAPPQAVKEGSWEETYEGW